MGSSQKPSLKKMEEQNHSEEYKHGSKDDGELSKLNKDWDNI